MTGYIRSYDIIASEQRVRKSMLIVDPLNHAIRVQDGQRRFNAVPYNSQYFGHKIHVDLNEKLVHFGVVLIGAIDGFSGMIVDIKVSHRKNNLDVCEMYRNAVLKYGTWDQVRVYHGKEFMLILYLQYKLDAYRYNQERKLFVQSTSRMVSNH